jgi:hypothetical protein
VGTVVFVEVLDRRGGVRSRTAVADLPTTIGRAYTNALILDDRFVCPEHARLVRDDQGWLALEDLDSVNGIYEAGRRERMRRVVIRSGTVVRVGQTRLRFVHPETAVPNAVPDNAADPGIERLARSRRVVVALVTALTAWLALSTYLGSYEGNTAADVIGVVIGVLLLLVLWAGAWAVPSRIVVQRFEFVPHLAVVAAIVLSATLYGQASDYLLFLFPLTGLAGVLVVFGLLLGVLLIYGHLLFASTLTRRRRVAWSAGVVLVLVALTGLLGLALEDEFKEYTEEPGALKPVPISLIPARPAVEYMASLNELQGEVDELAVEENGGPTGSSDERPSGADRSQMGMKE